MEKLVMTLLVRNESDILKTNIDYHLSNGVDFIIITDNNSEDNTPSIIRKYESLGVAKYIQESDDRYNQSKWVTRMARMAYNEYQADWVINNDADEFWWNDNGSLKDYFSKLDINTNVVEVERYNFVPFNNLNGMFFSEMKYREVISLNMQGNPLPPKAAHRGNPDIEVFQGNHGVKEFPNIKKIKGDLSIFHYPIRTYEQFEKKIEKGGAAYQRNQELNKGIGSTWRTLYKELLENGHLMNSFNNAAYSEHDISKDLSLGKLCIDKRLKEYIDNIYVNKII